MESISGLVDPIHPPSQLDDLKSLDDHESEIEWLNDLLINQQAHQADQLLPLSYLDSKLTKLSSKLELMISDTTTLVDKSIDEIARGVPRLSLDLQLMKENALLLRSSLKSIQSKSQLLNDGPPDPRRPPSPITPVDPNSNQSDHDDTHQLLTRLITLDLIKTRMESARTVLREAEAWSTLESEVTGYLTDAIPSYFKAAERLAEAAKSMVVFQHTPEYEGRRGLMRSLQNELEASLSTNLVKALSDKDVKRCKEFYEIFKMIEREGEFKNYYFGSRRTQISFLWSQTVLSPPSLLARSTLDPVADPNRVKLATDSLPVFLAKQFYPELIKLLQSELDFLPFIFANPVETLTSFLKSVLDNLKPSISTRLVESLDSAHILASWPSLISCWNLTEQAGWKLESLISQLESQIKQTADTTSTSPSGQILQLASNTSKSDRRSSIRRQTSKSISSKGVHESLNREESSTLPSQGTSMIKDWETSLYEPFIDFQSNSLERESNYLRAALKNMTFGLSTQPNFEANRIGQEMAVSMIQKLPIVLESMFDLSDRAIDRCDAFTHGYGILGCLKAIDVMISEYLDASRQSLITERENRERRKQNITRSNLNSSPGNVSSGNPRAQSGRIYFGGSDNQMLELDGLDYSSDDWEVFQLGLKLLASCKTAHDKMFEYEKRIKNRLVESLHVVRSKGSEEVLAMNEDLELMKIRLSKGAKVIIEQSTLNSSELWEFFDSLQPLNKLTIPSNSRSYRQDSLSHTSSMSTVANRRQSLQNAKVTTPLCQPQKALFPATNQSISNFIQESQHIVQSIILLPLLKQVNEYPHQSIWNQTENELQRINQSKSISTIDLKILNHFSKSPTESISKLGEGLFNLPRLFEIYTTVDEDALSFSLETLPFINYFEVLSNWHDFHQSVRRRSADNSILPSQQLDDLNHTQPSSQAPPTLSTEMVISTWLSSLTLTVVDRFSQTIQKYFAPNHQDIRKTATDSSSKNYSHGYSLTPSGKNQLVIDLDYLSNVVKALDVETDVLDKLKDQLI